ncbi:MAG: ECF-type sigma factor [Pirellulaceae bacterium]
MNDPQDIIRRIENGEAVASEQMLPMLYDQLRRVAAAKLYLEKATGSLQATELVHEAYLRIVGDDPNTSQWNGKGHFFCAAAEAMRRILIERARQRQAEKYGGKLHRVAPTALEHIAEHDPAHLVELNDALELLAKMDSEAAIIAKLRIFVGLSIDEAAKLLNMSRATTYRQWSYARAWLKDALNDDDIGDDVDT